MERFLLLLKAFAIKIKKQVYKAVGAKVDKHIRRSRKQCLPL